MLLLSQPWAAVHQTGDGVAKDPVQAALWHSRAAEARR